MRRRLLVSACVCSQCFVELRTRECEASRRPACIYDLGMPAKKRDKVRGVDRGGLLGKGCRPGTYQFRKIETRPKGRVGFPQRSPARGCLIGICKCADIECERPPVLRWQVREAGHAGSIEALFDHLIKREDAAFACPGLFGERDRGRIEPFRLRTLAIAGRSVATGAKLRVQRLAAFQVGRDRRRQRNGIGRQQIGSQRPCGFRDCGRR